VVWVVRYRYTKKKLSSSQTFPLFLFLRRAPGGDAGVASISDSVSDSGAESRSADLSSREKRSARRHQGGRSKGPVSSLGSETPQSQAQTPGSRLTVSKGPVSSLGSETLPAPPGSQAQTPGSRLTVSSLRTGASPLALRGVTQTQGSRLSVPSLRINASPVSLRGQAKPDGGTGEDGAVGAKIGTL